MDARRHAPATARNREPILAELRRLLPGGARVLEVGSGTGEHAAFLAAALGVACWQPSDGDPGALASIDAWGEAVDAVLPAIALDVTARAWPLGTFDAVFSANVIHIAPWDVALGLLDGASRHLAPGGRLVLYGPFRVGGVHTAPSNAAFDADLRARDPCWGIRDLEAVLEAGRAAGLELSERVQMPANNQLVVLHAPDAGAP